MTVLDTNVFSEVVKPEPSPFVMGWLAGQKPSAVFLTIVTQAELLYGLEAMQQGKRRKGLQSAIERILAEQFGRQMLPFDDAAAR